MIHPTVLDEHGNDIHTGAPPIYRLEDPILTHERYSDDEELSPALQWVLFAFIVASLAIFAWFALF
jgi:hypothetical protein